jgi:hypothetical protein
MSSYATGGFVKQSGCLLPLPVGLLPVTIGLLPLAFGWLPLTSAPAGTLQDGMESFFTSETAKYLYLLFHQSSALTDFYVLSTEGHVLPVLLRTSPNDTNPSFEERALRDATEPERQACSSLCVPLSLSKARAQVRSLHAVSSPTATCALLLL